MRIALDAMGGDHAPQLPVEGALAALDEFGDDLSVVLAGPASQIRDELKRHGRNGDPRIEIHDAPEVIAMSDRAGRAFREKPNSSLLRAIELHKDGSTDAVVSAGHTGAQLVASYMLLGLIEGVRRPTIGTLIPVGGGRFSVLLDVGANTDCKPKHLLQFAIMGSVLMEIIAGESNPRVALLSIGEEKNKGNDLIRATHYLLEESGLNFVGNVEGGDVFSGRADVLVCDGFVGNIVLKFAESVGSLIVNRLVRENGGESALSGSIRRLQKEFDYTEIGGVPLLGVNGISMICHGRSSAKAIKNAMREAVTLKSGNLPTALADGMARYGVGVVSRGIARFKRFQDRREEHGGKGEEDE